MVTSIVGGCSGAGTGKLRLETCQGRSTRAGCAGVTYTVGMYSPGKAFVV